MVGIFALVLVAVVLWRASDTDAPLRAMVPSPVGQGGGDVVSVPSASDRVALAEPYLTPILSTLLGRIYSAFEQTDEGAIYDGIASAVVPGLAADLYLQRRAVQVAEATQEGAADILELEVQAVTPIPQDPASFDVTWMVRGLVGHEDHQHERLNIYSARVTLAPTNGEWRVGQFDLDAVTRTDAPMFFDDF